MNKKKNTPAKRKPAPTFHIAVVMTTPETHHSSRSWGDYASFLGKTQAEAVTKANKAVVAWGSDKYHIVVGRLIGRVIQPVTYSVEKL